MVGNWFQKVRVCLLGRMPSRADDIKRWVEGGGGIIHSALKDDTTHLVVGPNDWKPERLNAAATAGPIKAALAKKGVFVVSYDWLDDSLRSKSKRSERAYLWTTAAAAMESKAGKKSRQRNNNKNNPNDKSVSVTGDASSSSSSSGGGAVSGGGRINYAKALTEHTDTFMTCRSGEQKSAVTVEPKTKQLPLKHHIYKDVTGFRFSVTLVKTDIATNKNERLTIKLYESNSLPHTYATFMEQSGTKKVVTSSIPAILGSNFETAFRAFRKLFLEKTGVAWEDRVKGFGKAKRQNLGTQDWDEIPFTYRLPRDDEPRGVFPTVVDENGEDEGEDEGEKEGDEEEE